MLWTIKHNVAKMLEFSIGMDVKSSLLVEDMSGNLYNIDNSHLTSYLLGLSKTQSLFF